MEGLGIVVRLEGLGNRHNNSTNQWKIKWNVKCKLELYIYIYIYECQDPPCSL